MATTCRTRAWRLVRGISVVVETAAEGDEDQLDDGCGAVVVDGNDLESCCHHRSC